MNSHDAETCPRCSVIKRPTLVAGTGPHACKANCSSCGKFLRWISLLAPSERVIHKAKAKRAAMAGKPPSQAQLEYLRALGDTLAAPADMAEASERIEALKRGQQ